MASLDVATSLFDTLINLFKKEKEEADWKSEISV